MKDETEEVNASNEKIARFMGIQVYQTYEEMQAVPLNDLKPWILPEQCMYHKSWDALMPVVEKITQYVYEEVTLDDGITKYIEKDRAHIRTFGMVHEETGEYMVRINRMPLHTAPTMIEAIYNAVVEWIDWYNEQNGKTE